MIACKLLKDRNSFIYVGLVYPQVFIEYLLYIRTMLSSWAIIENKIFLACERSVLKHAFQVLSSFSLSRTLVLPSVPLHLGLVSLSKQTYSAISHLPSPAHTKNTPLNFTFFSSFCSISLSFWQCFSKEFFT